MIREWQRRRYERRRREQSLAEFRAMRARYHARGYPLPLWLHEKIVKLEQELRA